MTVLKLALFGSLRIAILGSLKGAFVVYALFLSDTSFGGAVTEGNGHVGDPAYATESGGNGNANIGEAGARAGKRLELGF